MLVRRRACLLGGRPIPFRALWLTPNGEVEVHADSAMVEEFRLIQRAVRSDRMALNFSTCLRSALPRMGYRTKRGLQVRQRFVHYTVVPKCIYPQTSESPEHRSVKAQVRAACLVAGWEARCEVLLPHSVGPGRATLRPHFRDRAQHRQSLQTSIRHTGSRIPVVPRPPGSL